MDAYVCLCKYLFMYEQKANTFHIWAFSGLRIIGAPPPPTPIIFAKIIYMKGLS